MTDQAQIAAFAEAQAVFIARRQHGGRAFTVCKAFAVCEGSATMATISAPKRGVYGQCKSREPIPSSSKKEEEGRRPLGSLHSLCLGIGILAKAEVPAKSRKQEGGKRLL